MNNDQSFLIEVGTTSWSYGRDTGLLVANTIRFSAARVQSALVDVVCDVIMKLRKT